MSYWQREKKCQGTCTKEIKYPVKGTGKVSVSSRQESGKADGRNIGEAGGEKGDYGILETDIFP